MRNGTPYETYALENKILDKNDSFIEKKKGSSNFIFAFIYKDFTFGVWTDYKEGKIYISSDYDPTNPYIYAVTTQDFKPNTLLIKSASKNRQWKYLLEMYKLGLVYFENQKIKKYSQDVFRMFLNK